MRGLTTDEIGRPILDQGLLDLCAALRHANPQPLGHIDPAGILFVAGAARRGARASIRPMTLGGRPPTFRRDGWEKPQVWRRDTLVRYEICLRPRFFLAATADDRVRIIAHELWHIAPAFDGTLEASRRHRAPQADAEPAAVDAWVASWRAAGERAAAAVTHVGEARLSAWTERPPSRLGPTGRRRYTEDDLHSAVIIMR